MSVFRILLIGLLLANNASFGQVNSFDVNLGGSYHSRRQLDSIIVGIHGGSNSLEASKQSLDEYLKKGQRTSRDIKRVDVKKDARYPNIDSETLALFDRALAKAALEFRPEPTPMFQRYPNESFGLYETNYERFANSCCFEELGFSPYNRGTSEYEGQITKYKDCELKKVIRIILWIALVIVIIILFKPTLRIINMFQSKRTAAQLNSPINLSVAQEKLDELKKALDSGLIDEETFKEMKSKIQVRIRKDL
jgi:hypothetical protein